MTPCSIDYWIATIEVTLIRCVSVVDNQGLAPSPQTLTNDGLRIASDLGIMLRALSKLNFVDNITSWSPQGPIGGIGGSAWTFTTKLDSTPCD